MFPPPIRTRLSTPARMDTLSEVQRNDSVRLVDSGAGENQSKTPFSFVILINDDFLGFKNLKY